MSVGAVILCGGQSRRMGRPKAWLPFGPEYMLQRVVRRVSTVAGPLVVVAAPDQELPPLPERVAVARDPIGGRGPLQGLAAGLAALPESVELAFATATDVPFLEPAWISFLESLIGDHDLAVPFSGGFYHPLAALYRRNVALPAIEELLRQNRARPIFLMESLRTRIVTSLELSGVDPGLETLRNLNTFEDYQAALREAGFADDSAPSERSPPRVTVELLGVPRLRAGVERLTVSAANLGDALSALGRECPELRGSILSGERTLHPAYNVSLNGDRFTTDPETELHEGDQIILMALDAGG